MNIYPNCPKSRLTDYDREKVDALGYFIQMFFLLLSQMVTSLIFHQWSYDTSCKNWLLMEEMVTRKRNNFNVEKSIGPDGVYPMLLK